MLQIFLEVVPLCPDFYIGGCGESSTRWKGESFVEIQNERISYYRCHFAPIFPYRGGGDYAREKKGWTTMMNTRRNADAIRQLMKSPVWADDGAVKLYLYCLAMASHNQYCWRGLQLQPGDMPLSERKTAKALCWSRDKLRRRMRMLEV